MGTFGLTWASVGSTRPAGDELFSPLLASFLNTNEAQGVISRKEFDLLGITSLSPHSYIKVGDLFFIPVDPTLGLSWMPCRPAHRPPRGASVLSAGKASASSTKLAHALRSKLEFTRAEFESLGAVGLKHDAVVQLANCEPGREVYLQPSDTHTRQRRLVACARHVQRCFRIRQLMLTRFGADLFLRHDGGQAAYGKLLFASTPVARPFIVTAEASSTALLSAFLSKYWRLPPPEVIITVTGSGHGFHYNAAHDDWLPHFQAGLQAVVQSTDAWLFSSGANHGISKIIGEARLERPLIGILPAGAVYGHEVLLNSRGEYRNQKIDYKAQSATASEVGYSLDPGHTHFMLFDNGRAGSDVDWDAEAMKKRVALEEHVATSKGVPKVQLVVQGGEGTLAFTHIMAEGYTPIILIVESGGAAKAIFEYVARGDAEAALRELPFVRQQPQALARVQAHLEAIKMLHERTAGNLLTFVEHLETSEMPLLTAILKMRGHLKEKWTSVDGSPREAMTLDEPSGARSARKMDKRARLLKLAISWNRPEIVREQLKVIYEESFVTGGLLFNSATSTHEPHCSTPKKCCHFERPRVSGADRRPMIVSLGMELALELRRTRVVEDLLDEYSAEGSPTDVESICRHISMGQLYKACMEQRSTDGSMHQVFECTKAKDLSSFLVAHAKDITHLKGNKQSQTTMYRNFIVPFFGQLSWMLAEYVQQTTHLDASGTAHPCVTQVDVYFWANLMGADNLAEALWYKCNRPVRVALLGALLCKRVAAHIPYGYAHSQMRERASKLEQLACAVLDYAQGEQADQIIAQYVFEGERYQLLDLAHHGGMKQFLGHRHCERFMDLVWRGGDLLLHKPGDPTEEYTLPPHIWYVSVALQCVTVPFVRVFYALAEKQRYNGDRTDASIAHNIHLQDLQCAKLKVQRLREQAQITLENAKAKVRLMATAIINDIVVDVVNRGYARERAAKAQRAMEAKRDGAKGLRHPSSKAISFRHPPTIEERSTSRDLQEGLNEKSLAWTSVGNGLTHRMSVTKLSPRLTARHDLGQHVGLVQESKARAASASADLLMQIVGFYSIPAVRFFLRAITHVAWLGVYLNVIWDHGAIHDQWTRSIQQRTSKGYRGVGGFGALHYVWIVFHVAHFMDQRHLGMRQRLARVAVSDPWRRVWYIVDVLFVAAVVLFLVADGESNDHNIIYFYDLYTIAISLNVLLVCLLTMPYFAEWKLFGVLLIMVEEMVVDVFKWLLLLAIVLLAFSFCLLGFERAGWYVREDAQPGDRHPITFSNGAFWAPFWVLYGDVNTDAYRSMLESGTGVLIWVYCMAGSVILVNLLVAMMADTYSRVQADANAMFVYQRYTRIYAHGHLHTTVPPPFNLPWTLFDYITVQLGFRDNHKWPPHDQKGFTDGTPLLQAYRAAAHDASERAIERMLLRTEKKLRDEMLEQAEKIEVRHGAFRDFLAELRESQAELRDLLVQTPTARAAAVGSMSSAQPRKQ